MTTYAIYGIFLSIIMITLIITIVFVLYFRKQRPLLIHSTGNFSSIVKNTTQYPFTINTSTNTVSDIKIENDAIATINPKEEKSIRFGLHETTYFTGFTEKGTEMSFSIRPISEFSLLFITESGLGTSLDTNPDVTLINKTDEAFLFVLVSEKGSARFPIIVPPKGESKGHAIIIGQRWQIVRSTAPREILAEIIIRTRPTVITFDGKRLKSL